MLHPYGRPELGIHQVYYNDFLCLKDMVEEVVFFDYMTRFQKVGRVAMNEELLQIVTDMKPDVVFIALFTDQFLPEVIDAISKRTITVFPASDDMWRIEYTDFWAPHFTYVTTSYARGVQNMLARGHTNAIYMSMACNHRVYVKKDLLKKYDVSFIGGWHPHREWLIRWIERSGVKVHAWGENWEEGPIPHEGLVDVVNQSKINLNLQNETSWDLRYLLSSPRAILNTLRSRKHFAPVNLRVFEINTCGGFQLLPYMEGLEKRYDINNELVIFHDPEQLVERVHYYLAHADEREAIARRGYERSLRDHTLEGRYAALFEKMGMENWRKK
jgi:spore maturation protein CgeB